MADFVVKASQEVIQQKREKVAKKFFGSSAQTKKRTPVPIDAPRPAPVRKSLYGSSQVRKATIPPPKIAFTPYRSAFQSNQRSNELLPCLSEQEKRKALNPPACLKQLFDKRLICNLDDEAVQDKFAEYSRDVQNTAALFEACYLMKEGAKTAEEKTNYKLEIYANFQKQIQASLDKLTWIEVSPQSAFAAFKERYANIFFKGEKATTCTLGDIYGQALAKNKLTLLLDDLQNLLDLRSEEVERPIASSHQVRAGMRDLVEWLKAAQVTDENGRDSRIAYLCPRDFVGVDHSDRQQVVKPATDEFTPVGDDPAAVER